MRVVCVLSGGGAKTAAHIGAVQALLERGLVPGYFVGTSMGAVIGACFAAGLSYEEVISRAASVSRRDVARLAPGVLVGPWARSLLQREPLEETIGRLVPVDDFSDLRLPLTVTAVDAESGELVLFGANGRHDVPLRLALYASCALPVYYPPALIDGRAYLDGGLRAPLPLRVVESEAVDLVFAVYVGSSFSEEGPWREREPTLLAAHNNAMRIMMASQAEAEIAGWKGRAPLVLVRPVAEAQATFAVHRVVRYVERGYRAAVRALSDWERG